MILIFCKHKAQWNQVKRKLIFTQNNICEYCQINNDRSRIESLFLWNHYSISRISLIESMFLTKQLKFDFMMNWNTMAIHTQIMQSQTILQLPLSSLRTLPCQKQSKVSYVKKLFDKWISGTSNSLMGKYQPWEGHYKTVALFFKFSFHLYFLIMLADCE